MVYTIYMPEEQPAPVTDISKAALQEFRKKFSPYGRFIVGALMFDALLLFLYWSYPTRAVSFILVLLILPWFVLFFWFVHVWNKIELRFWKEFAAARGWAYEGKRTITRE